MSDSDETEQSIADMVCGQSISTYPNIAGTRCGDPIADRYSCKAWRERVLFVVTDGCNWGEKPKMASVKANTIFMQFMEQYVPRLNDLPDIGHYLLAATAEAHRSIEKDEDPGATTLLGGMMVRLVDGGWGVVMVNIGDCKAFHYFASGPAVIDVTEGNRSSLKNARDPGGRLGGYTEGHPDLRNLALYFQPLRDGDVVFVVSDGVHDNLDPQSLGVEPQQLLMDELTWNDVNDKRCQTAKTQFRARLVSMLMSQHNWTVQNVTTRLLKHSLNVTKKTREWMQSNPRKREPTNYAQYPGKMDHTTCLAIRVGAANSNSSSSSSSAVAELRSSPLSARKSTP